MFLVLAALLPAAIAHIVVFGPGLLLQLAIACPTALACEALALRLRGRSTAPFLRDGSVLVTAVLLAMSVTPLLPWWLTAAGTATAVLLGKHAFGGLGQNPFNPAMVGYAALLVSCPAEMTRWPLPAGAGSASWSDLAIADGSRLLRWTRPRSRRPGTLIPAPRRSTHCAPVSTSATRSRR